jgi:hypothetical protein
MIGKVSRLSTEPGERGRSHSVSPTSNASANSKRLGEVNQFEALTRYSPLHLSPSTAWAQLWTILLSQLPTTPQSYSSSQRLTWRSLTPTPCSLRPTRNSRRRWPSSRQPRHALPVLLVHLECPTNPFLGITVGLMAIVSASCTRVQRAVTRPRGTRTRRRPPTRWEVAILIRDGTHIAPDGVGWRLWQLQIILICVKTIIIML